MPLQIHTKRALRFTLPPTGAKDGGVEFKDVTSPSGETYFTTKPNEFHEAPDWIQGDPMFKMARKSGDLMVIQTISQEQVKDDLYPAASGAVEHPTEDPRGVLTSGVEQRMQVGDVTETGLKQPGPGAAQSVSAGGPRGKDKSFNGDRKPEDQKPDGENK